ncbi:hypothetical protein RRG08_016722 [Elysia crispata]|uniref:J domain-containing protein n=1 Tax=Elysia crispata TaxID=231223 RepID=A0AAE0YQI0_9GAST|nr:hypothetical protein RRG08_016722 [Elysia crispata]
MENLYEILQCAPTASRDELRRAYTRLALKHHPDKRAQRKAAENSSHLASQERLSSTLTANVKQEANCIPIDSNHHLNSSASSFGRSGIERDSEMSFSLVDSDEHVCGLDSTSGSTTTKDELPECEFVKIDMAWKILGHDDLRAEYDIKWQDRCLMQEHPPQLTDILMNCSNCGNTKVTNVICFFILISTHVCCYTIYLLCYDLHQIRCISDAVLQVSCDTSLTRRVFCDEINSHDLGNSHSDGTDIAGIAKGFLASWLSSRKALSC